MTRNLDDGVVEYVRKIKLWDKGKALEQLSKHWVSMVTRCRRSGIVTVRFRT